MRRDLRVGSVGGPWDLGPGLGLGLGVGLWGASLCRPRETRTLWLRRILERRFCS